MFFPLSKIAWLIIAPSHVLVWLVLASAICLLLKSRRIGLFFAVAAALLFIPIALFPTGHLLLEPIEEEYVPSAWPDHVDGILTLGGGMNARVRLIGVSVMARRYPNAMVVFSGTSPASVKGGLGRDARAAKQILIGLGLDPHRLILENRARNTWENLSFSQKLVNPGSSQTWVLATSALQLPRAMEVAARLHWKLIPWPTDYLADDFNLSGFGDVSGNLVAFDNAIHEWVGLYAYRWFGLGARN